MLIARGLAEESGKRIRLSTKAIVGATSKGLSGQIDAMFVAGPPPDAAVIMIGANDITRPNGIGPSARRLGRAVRRLRGSGAVVVVGTCPDFGVITAIPQPLRSVARSLGLRLARAQAAAVRAAGGIPVPFSDLLAPHFRKAPELLFSPDMFHPSAAGYALAAKQLLPALCNAFGEFNDGARPKMRSSLGTPRADRCCPGSATSAGCGAARPGSPRRSWSPRAQVRSCASWSAIVSQVRSIPRGAVMPEAVIVATARSPIGRADKGSLASMRPDDLATQMIRAALDKVPSLDPQEIDDLMLGCAQPAGEAGYNIARAVAVELGYDFLPGTTVNRYCSSSLQTTRMAFHAIKAGEGEVFISAGVETVSRFGMGAADGAPNTKNPMFAEAQARTAAGRRRDEWHDPREDGNIPDVYIAMGQTAENVAPLTGISREDQDHWGVRSPEPCGGRHQQRLLRPGDRAGEAARRYVVSTDDGPRAGTSYEKISQLKPVFRPNGTITAGNACPLNDGAAAVVIMSDTKAKALGLTPLARIVSTGVSGLSPEIMGLGPIEAIKKALAQAGKKISDIDLVEINEAFAVQVLGSARELGIDEDKLNVSGGAIASATRSA